MKNPKKLWHMAPITTHVSWVNWHLSQCQYHAQLPYWSNMIFIKQSTNTTSVLHSPLSMEITNFPFFFYISLILSSSFSGCRGGRGGERGGGWERLWWNKIVTVNNGSTNRVRISNEQPGDEREKKTGEVWDDAKLKFDQFQEVVLKYLLKPTLCSPSQAAP